MGECILARASGGGGGNGIGLDSYDAELTANSTTEMRVLVDVNGWEPGLYRGLFVYESDKYFYTFCPYILIKTSGDFSYGSNGADMVFTTDGQNYPNYYNSASYTTCGVGKYTPSTNVHRLSYTFNSTINNGTIEVLCAKFFKISL